MTSSSAVADEERCYRAVLSRDTRFDGVFFTGVQTTGIYCRPSCPATTPKRRNVTFFPTAAAAHSAGYRACRRCLPDATPGSPEWDLRADTVGRAMRLIRDGVVERDGVDGLAGRLGYSRRHVQRLLQSELGAGPLALARAQRAHTARTLIETTTLSFADITFASGFASVRQFNDTLQQVYGRAPRQMRAARARRSTPSNPGHGRLRLRLAVRQPFDAEGVLAFLTARAVPGVESVADRRYLRTLRLAHGPGLATLDLHGDSVIADLDLHDLRDLPAAVQQCRRLLDLDADPLAVAEVLASDAAMSPLVRARPGLRVPRHVNGFELAVRAIVGQQVSVARARALATDLVDRLGDDMVGSSAAAAPLHRLFPTPDRLAAADPTGMGMPESRGRAVVALSEAVAFGKLELDPGADRDDTRQALLALLGVGPWTAGYIAMRALGDPDVFLEGDVVVRGAMRSLALPAASGPAATRAFAWRPWRSYAVMHLWRHAAETPSPRTKEQCR